MRLRACVREIERHVAAGGWDQPPRLYALASTADLLAAEPHLAQALGADGDGGDGGGGGGGGGKGLTPIEQDSLPADRSVEDLLAGIIWPDAVVGCALAIERLVLPPHAEATLPQGSDEEVIAAAQAHPQRQDIRVVVGVDRAGRRACAVRVRGHEENSDLIMDPSSAPGLVAALQQTLGD